MMFTRTILYAGVVLAALASTAYSDQPGDYGYGHKELHENEIVRKLGGTKCCNKIGECRKTTVDVLRRKAWLEGTWCDIPQSVHIRTDIPLVDDVHGIYDVVCAGKALQSNGCPAFIWCAAASIMM